MVYDLARGEEFLSDFSLSELKQYVAAEKQRQPRLRLLVVLNRKEGKSIDQIADSVGLHRRAVHDILHRFEDRGISAAHALPKPGRNKRLNEKQLQDLRKKILKSPNKNGYGEGFWNSKMIVDLVKKKYKVTYTHEHVTRLLNKLGFSYKKPRPTNPRRASEEEIIAFKKKHVGRYWQPNEKNEIGL
jgi:putative transposase